LPEIGYGLREIVPLSGDLRVRCRSQARFSPRIAVPMPPSIAIAAIAIPIFVVAFHGNCCCQGNCAIGIQKANALRMLVSLFQLVV